MYDNHMKQQSQNITDRLTLKIFNVLPLPGGSVSYLDLTGSDQIVDVIESLLHCFTYWHQAMVPKDQHLKQTK